MKTRMRYFLWQPALLLLLLLSGCFNDEPLLTPEPSGGKLFKRYVAIGNSITAGYQSGGINASLQRQSYAVLLAQAMGTPFNLPLLNDPGCPPPFKNILTGERVANVPGGCALRQTPPPRFINNTAVPGAKVVDVINNFDPNGNANALTQFILGGYTQVQIASRVHPTFVTVWIGNNDVLGAAVMGTLDLLTPEADFKATYTAMLDSLVDMGVQGGLLIGVADVTLAPHFSPGIAYYQVEQMGGVFPPTFDVADNCATTGATSLIPFSYAFGVLFARAVQGQPVTLDCANDPYILTPDEVASIVQATHNYNVFIKQKADELGWAYMDPNELSQQLKDLGAIPPFPNLANPNELFGPYMSLDGLHPSSAAHKLLAQKAAEAIDAKYGTNLQAAFTQ